MPSGTWWPTDAVSDVEDLSWTNLKKSMLDGLQAQEQQLTLLKQQATTAAQSALSLVTPSAPSSPAPETPAPSQPLEAPALPKWEDLVKQWMPEPAASSTPAPTAQTSDISAPSVPVQGGAATTAPAPMPTSQGVASGPYDAQIDAAAQKYGVRPDIARRLVTQESDNNPNAANPSGARGLTQLMPGTARELGVDPNVPEQAIDGGIRYLKQMLDLFGGDYTRALAAYNWGPGNVARWDGNDATLPAETKTYVDTILNPRPAPAQTPQAAAGETPGSGRPAPMPGSYTPNQINAAKDEGLDYETALAVCGPAAAIAFARKTGRNPTMQEALGLAKQVGWTVGAGMAGPGSEQKLLANMGIAARLENGTPNWQAVAADVQRGNPVIISTPGHYFVAEQYDPQTGKFNFGQSAAILRKAGGQTWFTPKEIESLGMGAPRASLFMDSPTSPAPSVVAGASTQPSPMRSSDQTSSSDAQGPSTTSTVWSPDQPASPEPVAQTAYGRRGGGIYSRPPTLATPGADTVPLTDASASPPDASAPAPAPAVTSQPGAGASFQDDQTQSGWVQPGMNPGPPVPDMSGTVNTLGPELGPSAPPTVAATPSPTDQPPGLSLQERLNNDNQAGNALNSAISTVRTGLANGIQSVPGMPSAARGSSSGTSPLKPVWDEANNLIGYVKSGAEAAGSAITSGVKAANDVLTPINTGLASATQYALDNYGMGRDVQVAQRVAELESEASAYPSGSAPTFSTTGMLHGAQAIENVNPEWRRQNPEKAQELAGLYEEQRQTGLAMAGMVGAGGTGPEGEDVARRLAQEETPIGRAIGQGAQNVADAIGERVGRLPSGARPPAAVPAPAASNAEAWLDNAGWGERAPSAAPAGAPATSALEDAHAALDTLEAQGVDVVAARSALPERPTPAPPEAPAAPPEGRIPGMGYHDPATTSPEAAGLMRGARATYEANDLTTVPQAEIARRAERVIGLEPGTIERWQQERLTAGTTTEAVKGEALQQAAYGDAEAVVQAQRRFDTVQQEIADHVRSGGSVETLPEDLKQRAAEATTDLADLQQRFAPAARASTAQGTAMARALNQRKNLVSGRSAFQLAEQGRQLAEDAKQAATAVERATTRGVVDEGAQTALRTVRERLGKAVDEGQIAREADIQERLGTIERNAESARQQVRQQRGGPATPPEAGTAPPVTPKSETLAERLGRLKREHGAAEDAGDTAAATAKQSEIDGTLEEIRLRAAERAQKIANAKQAPLTPEEAQRAVDEAIGRRTVSKINAQAMADAKGRTQGEFLSQFDSQLGKKIDQAIAKDAKLQAQSQVTELAKQARDWHQRSLGDPANEEFQRQEALALGRLKHHSTLGNATADDLRARFLANRQEAADQFRFDLERRLTEAEKQRTAETDKQNLKDLHTEARTWLQRAIKEPDNAAFEEQFQQAAEKLAQHSTNGGKLALDLGNKLADTKAEGALTFHANLEKRLADDVRRQLAAEQKALEASRIRGVMTQIDDVLKNPQAPGAMDRLQQLHADLTDISLSGFEKSSALRERLYRQNLLRAGMSKDTGDLDALVKGLARVDPNDPTTIRPILAAIQRPTLWGIVREMQYVNMLSSPITHAVNASANGLQIAGRLLLNNPLEFIGSGGTSSGTGAAFEGSAKGLRHGADLARTVMRTGLNPDAVERAIETGQLSGVGRELLTEKFGTLGAAMHMVSTRPLEAMDAMLGHVAYAGAAEQYAQRTADRLLGSGAAEVKGMSRSAAKDYVLAHVWDYPEVIEKAGKIQDYTLLKSRDVEGGGWARVERQLRSVAGLRNVPENPTLADYLVSGLTDFIAPFFNVPLNYAKQGAERTFGAPVNAARFVGDVRAARAATTAEDRLAARTAAGEHFAKAMIGGATMASAVGLVASDNLTGDGPTDPGQRAIWLEDHQPNSWRVPGTTRWISWQGTPWGIPFATVAGAAEAYGEARQAGDKKGAPDAETLLKAGAGAYRGAVQGFLSQSFMQGIAQQYQFLTGQETGLGSVSANLASAANRYTPLVGSSMVAFLARITDDMERDAGKPLSVADLPQNVAARVATRIPGAREQVDPRLDAYGQPVKNQSYGPIGVLPYYRGPAPMEGDAITRRLETAGVGAPLAPPEITFRKMQIPLTMADRRLYQETAGKAFRREMEGIQRTGKEYPPEAYQQARTTARDAAETAVLQAIGSAEIRRRVEGRQPVGSAP